MAPDVSGLSDSERTRAIRDNRQAERKELQRRDAVRAEKSDQHEEGKAGSISQADDYSLPNIAEILQSFDEEEGQYS